MIFARIVYKETAVPGEKMDKPMKVTRQRKVVRLVAVIVVYTLVVGRVFLLPQKLSGFAAIDVVRLCVLPCTLLVT